MTPADVFLPRLSGVKSLPAARWKARWVALCPAHDDRSPSLYIAESNDTRLLIHCHSHNCPALHIVEAVGLDLKDLYPPDENYRSFFPKPRKSVGPSDDQITLMVASGMRERGEKLSRLDQQKEREAFLRLRASGAI